MDKLDKKLHDYLVEQSNAISDQWLALRETQAGSIYSAKAGEAAETLLRKQNRLTNLTVASKLLAEPEQFEQKKEEWASEVAESRASTNTPIYEVMDALRKVKIIYWRFVEQFIDLHSEEMKPQHALKWCALINEAFDELITRFAEIYYRLVNNRLSAQELLIVELSAPVIPITPTIGVLPLIGEIDATRAQALFDVVPQRCAETGVAHLFIDLSGVTTIDTLVAQQIHQITQVLRLLGIQSTISGMRPEIVQTAIQLGLDFSDVQTFGTLQLGLKKVLQSQSGKLLTETESETLVLEK
ncbi:STAS domain-containing protein [Sporosarcina cyprini]|uniref:STAS domain-containing protein n=1 Tax=Sporosarcina cyprini TaxID=2910523 RepID=UPI001EDFE852|nr:STAS domain-containing protein [Sporosarcina cyprini]MCG3086963.1 STAS domain-containing protein [Sporosarcina cyprini]